MTKKKCYMVIRTVLICFSETQRLNFNLQRGKLYSCTIPCHQLSQPYFILIYIATHSTSRSTPAVKKDIKPTYWCVLCRENGALEIYSLPDFKLAFCVRNFAVAPKVLMDSGTVG